MWRRFVGDLWNKGGVVSMTLEEALDTLEGDVEFCRKGVSCTTPEEALDKLEGDLQFLRKCVSLCMEGGNTFMFSHVV